MKATLDFEAKTIELECEPSLSEIAKLQDSLKDWKEWRIVGGTKTVFIPSQPYFPTVPTYPRPNWWEPQPHYPVITFTDTSGGTGRVPAVN